MIAGTIVQARTVDQKSTRAAECPVVAATVRDFFRKSKDVTSAVAARVTVNRKLQGIEQMTELSLDTKRKRILLRLELVGEAEPIQIDIIRYNLETKAGVTQLTVEEATASRPWVAAALQEFIVGERLFVPKKAAAILKLLT